MSAATPWGLTTAPFENALDPSFFFPSENHTEALARLEFLARDGGSQLGLLTGEIGCGKSLTRAVFARRSADVRMVAQVTSSHSPFPSLLREILVQFGGSDPGPAAAEYDLLSSLHRFMEARGWPAVVLLDEAQELDQGALVGVRALTNLADGRLPLTVILVGQPELRERVRTLPQLDQRAGLRYHLLPLRPDEVGAYVQFRLRTAGHGNGTIFTADAVEALGTASRGVPREINRIARLALALAAARQLPSVGERQIAAVVADLARQRGVRVP